MAAIGSPTVPCYFDEKGVATPCTGVMEHAHSDLAPKSSPALTGTPTAPTATDTSTGTTQIATLAWVITRITNWWNGIKSNYALASHTHSGYASANHNHDSAYAAKSHDHSGVYGIGIIDGTTLKTSTLSDQTIAASLVQIYTVANDCYLVINYNSVDGYIQFYINDSSHIIGGCSNESDYSNDNLCFSVPVKKGVKIYASRGKSSTNKVNFTFIEYKLF